MKYFAFVLLALLSDRCSVAVGGDRTMKRNGDTDTRDANENHRHQVDDNEQQQEEPATKMTEVVETIGTDLAGRNAVTTVDCERVTAAVQVR